MAFFYTRPTRLHLSQECQKIAKSMRRQPLHKNGKINFKEHKKRKEEDVEENGNGAVDIKEEPKTLNESSSDEKTSNTSNDSKESIDTLDGSSISKETRVDKRKLNKIVMKLSERMASKLALNGNSSNGHHNHHHASTAVIPTSYSLASHIANSINSQSPHQHVSPRKRILRELEKVTLEDTKRSRPKSVTTNGTHPPPQSVVVSAPTSNGSLNKNNENKAPPVSSRPISSYSITSLLAHNTTSSSSSSSMSSSINNNNDSSSLTTSLHHQSRLQSPTPKSPVQKRKSPHNMQSPIQSPSPEHHAFHKYRPMTTTPTSQASMPPASASSPYNSSYHSPTSASYIRGSPSPSTDALNSRLRTTGNYQHSPSHHYAGTSSPSNSNYLNRDSSLSPNVEKASSSNRSTPTTPVVRTVPKKTAALRQQFSSPTMNDKKASPNVKSEVKPMDVDSLLRPSALIPPPPMPQMTHPAAAAALSHYPYMYSPLSYLPPPAVPPYYHPFYNPAMMAAAAAAYRFPMPGYPALAPQHQQPPPSVTYETTKSTSNGQQRNSSPPPPSQLHHHPAYSSPWNPIPITNHSINDGNLIPKVKDEPLSSGEKNLFY